MRAALPLMAGLLVLSASSAADAKTPDPKSAAAQLIDEGNALLERRQFQAALARYRAAHELYPTPKIFYNMAEASRELGKLGEAATLFERFLAESGVPDRSPLRRAAERAIEALDAKLGRISIDGLALGAEVFVDGAPAGRVPIERMRVPPGRREVVIQKQGFLPKRAEIEVIAGRELELEATLEPVAPPPIAGAPPEPAVAASASLEEESGSILTEWWFWTIIAGAAAIGVGAAVIATTTGGEPHELKGELGVSSTSDWRPL